MREGKVNLHAPSLFLHDFPLNVTQEAKFVFHRLFFFIQQSLKKILSNDPMALKLLNWTEMALCLVFQLSQTML